MSDIPVFIGSRHFDTPTTVRKVKRYKAITTTMVKIAKERKSEGETWQDIAELLGVSTSGIVSAVKRYKC